MNIDVEIIDSLEINTGVLSDVDVSVVVNDILNENVIILDELDIDADVDFTSFQTPDPTGLALELWEALGEFDGYAISAIGEAVEIFDKTTLEFNVTVLENLDIDVELGC